MKDPKYIEMILRTNPDVIYSSPFVRTKKTAEIIQEIFRTHRQKDIPIILDEGLAAESGKELASYTSILEKEVGKTVLLISHNPTFSVLRSHFYDTKHPPVLEKM
jgi:phosphohistidine phosphatase SixA